MRQPWQRAASIASILVLFAGSSPLAAEEREIDLTPLVERLESPSSADRVRALRELLRLRPPVEQVRPLLEAKLADQDAYFRQELVAAVYELMRADGVDLLEKLYADPDRAVRDGAVRFACRLWSDKRARELCRAAFEDPDYSVRVEVLSTLREEYPRDPEAIELFRRGLEDPSEVVIRSAILGVQAARDAASVERLGEIARSYSDLAALPAVDEALATIGNAAAAEVLISLLPKPKAKPGQPVRPSDLVRAAAARATGRIHATAALPHLRALLTDPSVPVRIGAIGAITAMEDRSAVGALLPLLEDPEPRVRRYTLRAVRKLGDASAAEAVRRRLFEDKDAEVRASACLALADLLGEKAIPDLMRAADDLDPLVRLEAAGSLAGLGPAAADALVTFVVDADAGVRAMAIEGIGQVGTGKQVPALVEAGQKARLPAVRAAVAQALGMIGGEAAVEPLAEIFSADADPKVRVQAAAALGRIGGDSAVAALERLLKDPSTSVRGAARRALSRLGRPVAAGSAG